MTVNLFKTMRDKRQWNNIKYQKENVNKWT